MKRQFLEECYAKITEEPAAVKLEGRKIGRGAQDVEPGDLGSAEP